MDIDESHGDGESWPPRATRRLRNYFSRREQYRLLSLVFTLLLVVFLMGEAAKPRNWRWMWQMGQESSARSTEDASIDTRIPERASDPLPADVFVSAARSRNHVVPAGVLANRWKVVESLDFACLKDDTVFRAAESETWYGILAALQEVEPAELQRSSMGSVGFTQLFRQTNEYRGRTISVSGTVRRAFLLAAGKNEFGIESYWRCWLQPDGSQNPIVVYSLQMPPDFPEGMAIRERVEWHGVFFKRWAYAAKQGTRTAPLVLAKHPDWIKRPPIVPKKVPRTRDMIGVALGALVAALFLTTWICARSRTSTRRVATETIAGAVLVALLLTAATASSQEPTGEPSSIQTVRQYLQLYEIDERGLIELGAAADSESQSESALRLFQRLRRLPVSIEKSGVYAWSDKNSDQRPAVADLVRVRAQLQQIEIIPLPDDLKDRFEASQFYRCRCLIGADEATAQTVVVLADVVPKRWVAKVGSTTFNEQVTFTGLVLSPPDSQPLVLATDRLAWHPRNTNDELEISDDHVLLGRHGFDVGQLDEVRPKGPLSRFDRAAFYGLLLAVGRVPTAQLENAAAHVNVTELLQHSESHRGKMYELTGTARRCIRILVDDDESNEYGISSYYELVLFLDPDAIVKIRSTNDSDGKYFATYPVVVCVRALPDGFPEGEAIHAACKVVGSYLKLWAYPSEYMQAGKSKSLQFSPLLIGNAPVLLKPNKLEDPLSGPGLAIGFAASLLLLSGLVWWWSHGDAKFKRETLSRKYDLPADVQLDKQEFTTTDEPKFDE